MTTEESPRSDDRDAHLERAPRILVIASTFPAYEGDGTPAFVSDLVKVQSRRSEVLVVTPRVPGAPDIERPTDHLTIVRFAYFPKRWERLAHGAIIENLRNHRSTLIQAPFLFAAEFAAVRKAVRSFRPDVIHAHWIVPQGIVAVAAARKIPLVVTTLGGDIYALRGPLWRPIHRAVLGRAAAVTTMNDDMRARLLELGAEANRTSVMPMGSDMDTIRAAGRGVEPVPGRILVAARLVEKKGIHVLLEALRGIGDGPVGPNAWSLDVIGSGPVEDQLRTLADGMPVRFCGQRSREELGRALHEAEIFVVPSVPAASGDQDGLPVVLLDAMSAGTSIVASDLPGINEAIEDGSSGILVPAGDPRALRDAIVGLLADPARRASLASGARRRSESYSVDAIGERYAELIRSVVRPDVHR